ncbi:zinc finger protein GAI-ASSOCIATED FACTOR 1-like [Primulina eburnea]|uniref:zinc finger protein GAI-ASSOCIATED FACTOR 1-like n=1 Tax=Primulina eburnea TaxID=1245227 RepID=UPI003C6C54E0
MVQIENSASQASGESRFLLSDNHVKSEQSVEPTLPVKKKRNLPGMPDPDAEVIALSPKTLMATNRFVCEICNKGFQRDQNLQLHRRGHNLPWKLRQRTNKEVRKRVYLCPEPTCIHHDPSRALGDLTGIKKHFCRKHGEKKFKCERCSKKYAVQSDWKAHMKTCGTREYRCDCGTLFSRRDSFITHRAFCDALAQESALSQPLAIMSSGGVMKLQVVAPPVAAVVSSPPPPPLTPSAGMLSPVLSIQSSEFPENHIPQLPPPPGAAAPFPGAPTVTASNSSTSSENVPGNGGVFASIFNVSTSAEHSHTAQPPVASYSTMLCTMNGPDQQVIDPMSLSLSSTLYLSSGSSSLYPAALEHPHRHYTPTPQPALSATALLQKAAQMGATSSNSSFLRGFGLSMIPPPDPQDLRNSVTAPSHWSNTTHVKLENNSVASGLGLGLPSSSSPASFNELMMNSSSLFGNVKPATLDFLGLGMGAGETSAGGFSAFLSSITGELDMTTNNSFAGVGSTMDTWDYPSDRKPSML